MKRVCHITTVHPARDTRIFYKECKSLAKAGYDVKLIVINSDSFMEDGVEVIGVPCKYSGRIMRFFKASLAAYRKALEVDADIYHFHDPEFLPWASRLIKNGKKVVYDVHEDLPRQMLSKYWIPTVLRKPISFLTEIGEDHYSSNMTHVISATDFIRDRFADRNSNASSVKNYPVLLNNKPEVNWNKKQNEISYVGSITKVRGISELITSLSLTEKKIRLNLAGNFVLEEFKQELEKSPGWDRVNIVGFANKEKVEELLGRSFAGIVTLHPIINYLDALPVKMFEYMAAGIPVIASDFPLWRQIINAAECGICVDPLNPNTIAEAINYLYLNPEKAKEMGINGQKAVYQKYNWEEEEKKLLEIYSTIDL